MKNMKKNKVLVVALVLMLICSMLPMGVFASNQVKGTDQIVRFAIDQQNYAKGGAVIGTDIAPYIKDDRTMVPVAFVAPALGTDRAVWNPETRMVTIARGNDLIVITIGSNELLVNGKPLAMDTVAEIKDVGNGGGRTMLPIAFIARALNVGYEWDGLTRSVDFYGYSENHKVPGTFGPATGTETIYGNVILSSEEVRLQNKIIKGHLIIEKSEGTGDMFLDNISVERNTYVRSKGKDIIHINGGSFVNLEIISADAVVSAVGETTIQNIMINNRATVKVAKGTKVGEVTFNSAATLEGEGTVETANVNTNGVVILTEITPPINLADGINKPVTTKITPPAPVSTTGGGGGSSSEPTSIPITGLTITGEAMVGKTLTATPTPSNATGNYLWQVSANGTDGWTTISGATSSTYVIAPGYTSSYIRVSMTGTGSYSGTQISNVIGYIQESTDASLISVLGQTDSNPGGNGESSDTPFTWEINVANAVEELVLGDIEIASGATVGIYSTATFSLNSIATIPLAAGETTVAYIKVTAQDTSARYYAVRINRAGIAVESVSINVDTNTIDVGATTQLIAVVQPENSTNQAVTWSSSEEGIATVNTSGLVTGVSVGSVTITVMTTDGGYTATTTITSVIPLPSQNGSPEFLGGVPAKFGTETIIGTGTLTTTTNLTYTWYRSANAIFDVATDTPVNTGTTYTPTVGDISNYLIIVATTPDAIGNGIVTTSMVVLKATYVGLDMIIPPSVDSVTPPTAYTITLEDLGAHYEYVVSHIDGTETPGAWQSSRLFTGLSPETAYRFKSRVAATATHLASDESFVSDVISTISGPISVGNFTVLEGQTYNGQVLGGTPDYVLMVGPEKGTLTFSNVGLINYTAHRQLTTGFVANDSFVYRSSEGNYYMVGVIITPVNDAPVATPSSFTVAQGGTHGGIVSATDVDGDVLTYSLVTGPSKGTLTFNSNGSFSYIQNEADPGVNDSFTFKANDGLADSDNATVTITIT